MNKFHSRERTSLQSSQMICTEESFLLHRLQTLLLTEPPLKHLGGVPHLLLHYGGDVGDGASPHAPHLGHLEPPGVGLAEL